MRIRWTLAAAADLKQISNYLRQRHPYYRQPTIRKIYDAILTLRECRIVVNPVEKKGRES